MSPPPVPFLHGCIAEEREDFLLLFPTLGSPPSCYLLCVLMIIFAECGEGVFAGATLIFCPGLKGWIVETAPGCRLLNN